MIKGDDMMTHDLASWVEENFYQFDMVQLVEVIREILDRTSGDVYDNAHNDIHHDISNDSPRNPRIFFEADPSLAFPPGDVSFVKIGKSQATARLPVLNILGASSPLPVWFLDYVCKGGHGADSLQNFLSIMQNRLHKLWVDAHLKYNIWSDNGNPAKRIFEKMSARSLGQFEDYDLFCLGAFSGRAKSADGLKLLIKSIWKDIPVRIEENIGRWTPVENLRPLGRGPRLGINAAAGSKIYDCASKFRVSLNAIDIDTYKTFMPDEYNCTLLKKIIRLYIDEPLICELEITCNQRDLEPARIGECGLGRTAALGRAGGGDAGIHRYRTVFS
jgi:type VI secretion system protein ImpH